MSIKFSFTKIVYISWCGLGFYRGLNYYKYKNINEKIKESYLYSNSIVYGIFGIVIYGNPLFLPISIYKELYRLEVNVRNLEIEKKSTFYNNLL